MKKRIIIGDMHGRFEDVKNIYNYEQPDDVIMLGDYVDTHELISDEQQHEGLLNLIALRKQHIDSNKGEFILLMGNHDFHYFYDDIRTEKYSGYNYHRADWATPIFKELIVNRDMQMIYRDVINKIVFSHAGISNTWLKENNIDFFDINSYIKNEYDREVFRFTYGNTTHLSGYSNTGDCKESSCIWIRPFSLLNDMYIDSNDEIWTQIVGHTPCTKHIVCITPNETGEVPAKDAKLILTDNLPNQYIVEWLNDDGTLHSREISDNMFKSTVNNHLYN